MSDQQPDPHACIFHNRLRALQVFRIQDSQTKAWFQYGLCPICANRLKKQESFKKDISDRLEEILEQSKKKQEMKNARKV
jgi:hypothetical protein